MRQISSFTFVVAALVLVTVACKDAAKSSPSVDAGASTTVASASAAPVATATASEAASEAASAAPAGSGAIAADESGVLALSWKAVNAGNAGKDVTVSAVVGSEVRGAEVVRMARRERGGLEIRLRGQGRTARNARFPRSVV